MDRRSGFGRYWPAIIVAICFPPLFDLALGNEPPDPRRFESAIVAFESQDARRMPPANAIVCTGSSSMKMWHDRIADDLAPLTVIPRGFGGSTMDDLLYYADRVILRYKPRAVMIYEGDNDTNFGLTPQHVEQTFRKLVRKLHQHNGKLRIYFLAIKPSPKRAAIWPAASRANQLIKEVCAKDERLFYIDVATPMFDAQGKPNRKLFIQDNLHMNRKGYELWREIIRPILLQHEQQYEVSS